MALLVLSVAAVAGEGGAPAGPGFDRLADQLERGELVITTHADALKLLDQLKHDIPTGDVRRELRYRYMFCILGMHDDPAKGVAYAEQGIVDARRVGYVDAEVNFHFCRGANQESLTTPRDALPDYNAGIELARRVENTRLVADGLTWRGSVQSLLGEHAHALVDFLEAQKFYDSAGEPIESEQNLFNIAVAYRRLGERKEARGYLDRLMELGGKRKDVPQQMAAHMELGFLDSETGQDRLAAAREHFLAALQMARSIGSHGSQGSAHLGLAQVLNQLTTMARWLSSRRRAPSSSRRTTAPMATCWRCRKARRMPGWAITPRPSATTTDLKPSCRKAATCAISPTCSTIARAATKHWGKPARRWRISGAW